MDKIITAIEPQKKNKNRLNIFVDNEFAFGIDRFAGRSLKVGQILNSAKIQELEIADEREKAYQRALKYISYKPRTKTEIFFKLKSLNFDELTIRAVTEELEEKKYLNDEEYAQDWVQLRSASKPRSKKQLSFELRRKGISEKDIQNALKYAPEDFVSAMNLSRKYKNRYKNLKEIDYRKKMFGVLARRAYPFEIINRVIEKNLSEIEYKENELE